MTRSRQTADWGSRAGLAKIVPSSVAVGSGTGSADALGTVTFSGASSVSLNNVFSATYRNYKIVLNATASATPTINIRFRVNGTDNSTASSYVVTYLYGQGTSATSATETGAQGIIGSSASTTVSGNANIDVFAPFLTVNTLFHSLNADSGNSVVVRMGLHNQSTSYDGFTFTASTGTISGTITVLGYN